MWHRVPSSFYLRKFRRVMLHPIRRSKWDQYLRYREASRSFRRHLQSRKFTSSNLLKHLTMCFTRYETQPSPETYHTLINFLFRNSRLHQIPDVLNHLENHEKFQLPEAMFVDMIHSYGAAHRIEDALHLFERIPHLRCSRSVYSLDALLNVLCRNREGLCKVPEILSKCAETNIRLESSTFQLLITALCTRGRIIHAMDILNCMVENGFSPDQKTYSLLLSSLCEDKEIYKIEDAMGVLFELSKTGFSPNLQDYKNLLSFLDDKSGGLKAFEVLNGMKSDGIKPNADCYTSVLSVLTHCGYYEKADKLFDEMLVYGIVPSIHTYNTYIKCLCKQNRMEEALKMMKAMEILGSKCNSTTYNTILEWCCTNRKVVRAKELAKEMETKGVSRDIEFYRIMMSLSIEIGETREACNLLDEALQSGLVIAGSSMDEILCLLCEKKMISTAVEIVHKFASANVGPSDKGWEALLIFSHLEHSPNIHNLFKSIITL